MKNAHTRILHISPVILVIRLISWLGGEGAVERPKSYISWFPQGFFGTFSFKCEKNENTHTHTRILHISSVIPVIRLISWLGGGVCTQNPIFRDFVRAFSGLFHLNVRKNEKRTHTRILHTSLLSFRLYDWYHGWEGGVVHSKSYISWFRQGFFGTFSFKCEKKWKTHTRVFYTSLLSF